jgi:hypothetical protein
MFNSVGTLIYSEDPYKLIVDVDNEIGNYYRLLIPKYFQVRKPMYSSHISVVRNEVPPQVAHWGKYQGVEINFEYEPFIYGGELYYWLNAYSPMLEDIRLELGLPNLSKYTKSPDGSHRFHITIGNTKHLWVR